MILFLGPRIFSGHFLLSLHDGWSFVALRIAKENRQRCKHSPFHSRKSVARTPILSRDGSISSLPCILARIHKRTHTRVIWKCRVKMRSHSFGTFVWTMFAMMRLTRGRILIRLNPRSFVTTRCPKWSLSSVSLISSVSKNLQVHNTTFYWPAVVNNSKVEFISKKWRTNGYLIAYLNASKHVRGEHTREHVAKQTADRIILTRFAKNGEDPGSATCCTRRVRCDEEMGELDSCSSSSHISSDGKDDNCWSWTRVLRNPFGVHRRCSCRWFLG